MANNFKVNNFDLLRLFAATQVVLNHALAHLHIAKPLWWSLVDAFPGVPIFFVISGFLISASFERSSSVKNYARNRLLRIYPGLWCCVFITIGVALVFGFNFAHFPAVAWFFGQLAGVIYTPQFLKGFGFGSYNGSLWTIPVELQFYLILPVLYWLTRNKKMRTLYIALIFCAFLIIAFLTIRVFRPLSEVAAEPTLQKLIRYSFFPHIYLFLAGVLLQRWGAYNSVWVANKGLYWLAGYLAYYYLVPYSAVTYLVASLILGITIVSIAYTSPRLSEQLLRRNDISYGVYIYHGLIINILVQLRFSGRFQYLLTVLLLTYLSGYISWILVESPFLSRKKQSIHPVSQGAVSAASLW